MEIISIYCIVLNRTIELKRIPSNMTGTIHSLFQYGERTQRARESRTDEPQRGRECGTYDGWPES